MSVAAWGLAALAAPLLQGDNRLWEADVELVGPLSGAVLDCGAAGRTRLAGDLLLGERRTLRVPLPLVSPLGLPGLAELPAPRVEVAGVGAVRFAGFAREQPAELWERLPIALRQRPRPPAPTPAGGASPAALTVAACASLAGIFLGERRRLARALACVAGAVIAAFLVGRAAPREAAIAVVDVDRAAGAALRAEARRGEIDLAPGTLRLEAGAAAGSLELTVDLASGRRRARGTGVLVRFEALADPGDEQLACAWHRDAAGVWTRWENLAGGAGTLRDGEDPPGWLVAGLPQGRPALLGRTAQGGYVRVVGAERPLER